MTKSRSKVKKWTKVNIYTQQAEKIEEYMEQPSICSKFGILSKSNFVQNAVRREIARIEADLASKKRLKPVEELPDPSSSIAPEMSGIKKNADVSNTKTTDIHAEDVKSDNSDDVSVSNYGMGAIMRRMDTKKEIERITKANTKEAEFKKRLQKLEQMLKTRDEEARQLKRELKKINEQKTLTDSEESKKEKMLEKLQKKLEHKDKQTQKLAEDVKSLREKIEEKDKKAQKYERQLEELKSATRELKELKEKLRIQEIRKLKRELTQQQDQEYQLNKKIADLHKKMEQASQDMLFEKAAEYRDRINMSKKEAETLKEQIGRLERELRRKEGTEIYGSRIESIKRRQSSQPPSPKLPPRSDSKQRDFDFDEDDEADIVDALYGDKGADSEVYKDTNDPVNQVNSLLKEGFSYENDGHNLKASRSFLRAAELLEEIVSSTRLDPSDQDDLKKKIESYREHALYLKDS